MYKTIFFIALFFFISFHVSSQEDYLDEIANKSCECIKEKKAIQDELSSMELGVCLILSAKEYKEQILKDYNIDISNLDGINGEKLGELIGAKVAFICPEVLTTLDGTEEDEIENFIVSGKIKNIRTESIVIFELKSDKGKIEKFYWLTFIETEFDLQNLHKELKNKRVEIGYTEQELFDPRINEYRKVNVINSLKVD